MSAAFEFAHEVPAGMSFRLLQPTIGAEISGVNLARPISDAERDAIKALILKYKMVFFRDQHIGRDQYMDFARRFGRIYNPPYAISNPINGAPGLHQVKATEFQKAREEYLGNRKDEVSEFYHTDTSWRLVPAWGALLRDINLPEVGGDTVFVDAGLAFAQLSERLKQRLDGLFATHDFRSEILKCGQDYPIVSHPIIRTHRETGEKILWVNFTQCPKILGLDRSESSELLDIIERHYSRPEFQVRFAWRKGSVVFWDNRASVHYAVRNYGDYPRVLERLLIADEALWTNL